MAWERSIDVEPELRKPAAFGVRLRPRELKDIPAVLDLVRRVYPPPHGPEAIWPASSLAEHIERFPEAQLVAETAEGEIAADATALRLSLARALAPHDWAGITGGGRLSTHEPGGAAFYGVDIVVDPELQGRGLGARLYKARMELARRLGCTHFVAGARIPGYHKVAGFLSAEDYVADVAAGRRMDPTLSKQLHLGFQVHGLLPGYIKDYETCNYAVLISRRLL